PDANPADALADFLTNPYYGLTQFDASRLGDLSTYRSYCQAAGLFVSPVVTTQAAANQFLSDLMSATNSALVWSGGLLTAVPYGDAALSANGATYAPPAAPLYALGDDDFLAANQATNPKSSAAASSPDPVIVTRLDRADQQNDVKLEYLDRANQYNPTIVEAKDDAAIALFGLKNSGSKQLHLFCNAKAALSAAHLMLGRESVLRSFAFTLDRKYILLDPMDIVALTDANAGLADQWVRIIEITENDDRSLSIVAEEYLEGTGAAPLYGMQRAAPFPAQSRLGAPPDALAPMFLDAPVQVGKALQMETILCTAGSGPNWGGCDIWISSDNQNFRYAGTLLGGTVMGTLTASFASGSDPDTANTLAVDLSETQGTLAGGTQADADQGHTLCLVDQELVTYQQATLTGQWKYNLGKSGASAGYLRRGVYGTAIAAHGSGAPFARLRAGSYFTLGYDATDIGKAIYVKLLSFNHWGGGKQSLDGVTSYSHTLAAPPLLAAGLLPGLIQAPDVALGAATSQAIGSQPNHVAIPVAPTKATLVTLPLSTIGQPVQLAYNAQFINQSAASSDTVTWYLNCDGTQIDTGNVTIAASSAATIAKQAVNTPAAGAHSFTLQATDTSGIGFTIALLIDLTATEIRR
ncbi:MAG: phage tail protein, partial [Stellaceae bacterium]